MTDSRHRQLSRIYQHPIEDGDDARAAIAADPGVLASALFLEAVESDDVTSIESAQQYLADRIEFFGDLVSLAAEPIRAEFETRVQAWR
ncbi:MAG: hypothetical protein ABI577_17950 [bacterium]